MRVTPEGTAPATRHVLGSNMALIGVFVLKFAKIIGIGVAAFMGGLWKLFGRRRSDA